MKKNNHIATNGRFHCMDCAHATPVNEHWNLDYTNHAPICYSCDLIKNRLVIRSDRICENFKKK